MNPFKSELGVFVLAVSAMMAGAVAAQSYPAKAIHIIVSFASGGQVDLLARMIGEKLQEAWGQPVVIDYKPGAGGNIGMDIAAKASPDGYTLIVAAAGNLTVNPHMYAKLPYDVLTDFAPITLLATADNLLVVTPELPAKNIQELIALARSKPGTLTFASTGSGSQAHVAGELLKGLTRTDMVHVAYKGAGPALVDLMGGRISMMFIQTSLSLPHIKAGRLRALGVASLKRSTVLPDLPTIAEQGLPGFEAVSWYALMAPTGTPSDVVAKLNAEVTRILQLPDVREKLAALGVDPRSTKPDELAAMVKSEWTHWKKVVKDANIRADE